MKNQAGDKEKVRLFDLLNKNGLYHGGNILGTIGDGVGLRFTVEYGTGGARPFAFVGWSANLGGPPALGWTPHYLRLVFASGDIKEVPISTWNYTFQVVPGNMFMPPTKYHSYDGTIVLSEVDVYDIARRGDIASIYIDNGNDKKHFFYSGDKDTKNKARLTTGFRHACKMLGINDESIQALLRENAARQELDRQQKLRAEVKQEIMRDQERERLKQEILAELEADRKASQ